MKKVIALALTLAMVLTMGVVAFADAATFADIDVVDGKVFKLDEKVVIRIDADSKEFTVKDANGFMTFGTVLTVEDANGTYYVVEATGTKEGVTAIETWVEGKDTAADTVNVKIEAEKPTDPFEGYKFYNNVDEIKDQDFQSSITIDLEKDDGTYFEGFTAAVYNAATKLHPETIVIEGKDFAVTLYRGDYKTTTLAKDVNIVVGVDIADALYVTKKGAVVVDATTEGKENTPLNNRVLSALGNTKADPYYVMVETANLDAVADKPELSVILASDNFYQWAKTNNRKAMTMYSFDASDDTVAVVASNIKVNNNFDNVLAMPTVASGIYVLADSANGASSSANVKDNVSTGANDMMAVAVVFATIALAAGVSKKVR